MIAGIANISIDPARAADFEAAVAKAAPHFRVAEGCRGMALQRVIEHPARYKLVVLWETVEHHTLKFRGSEGFRAWRMLVGPFFMGTPEVIHTTTVAKHF